MKISTSQTFDTAVSQMNRQQAKIADMQAKADADESKFIKVSEKEFDELKKNGF